MIYWVVLYLSCNVQHECRAFNYGSPMDSWAQCEAGQTYVYSTGHPQVVPIPEGYLTEECMPFLVDNGDYFRFSQSMTEKFSGRVAL